MAKFAFPETKSASWSNFVDNAAKSVSAVLSDNLQANLSANQASLLRLVFEFVASGTTRSVCFGATDRNLVSVICTSFAVSRTGYAAFSAKCEDTCPTLIVSCAGFAETNYCRDCN
jgi:hypothetical protein